LIDLTLQNYQFIALSFSVDRPDDDLYYVVDPMPKLKDVGLHCSVLFLVSIASILDVTACLH